MRNVLLVLLVLVFGFVLTQTDYGFSHKEKNKILEQISLAKKEMEKTKKLGFLWRDVNKFIKQSEDALKNGNEKKSLILVKKAIFQIKMGQQQAKDQANAKPRF